MAASGAEVDVEQLLHRPLYPLFRTLPATDWSKDTRTDEEKLQEVREVAEIFKEEYTEGQRNLANLPPEIRRKGDGSVEDIPTGFGEDWELFAEAGVFPTRRTSQKTQQEIDDVKAEFKEFM
jgi:hypothetical protein